MFFLIFSHYFVDLSGFKAYIKPNNGRNLKKNDNKKIDYRSLRFGKIAKLEVLPEIMLFFWNFVKNEINLVSFFFRKDVKSKNCDGSAGLTCTFPGDCRIGDTVKVNCTSRKGCPNPVSRNNVEAVCRFCWQLLPGDYDCEPATNCSTSSTKLLVTKCSVSNFFNLISVLKYLIFKKKLNFQAHSSVICMGQRNFYKRIPCNWSSGYSWTKTMILSVVLGGFGADRFYLGLWKSAIGKLFSFGGLGVWTLVDVVLIAVGYIKPYDGSMYIWFFF